MKIRLYKPVSLMLIKILGNNQRDWESRISAWAGFPVKNPKYFWEVHIFIINNRVPAKLTVECFPESGWYSVFYSYNLNGDLKKYLEIVILRKCKRQRKPDENLNSKLAG